MLYVIILIIQFIFIMLYVILSLFDVVAQIKQNKNEGAWSS